jgi:hypothetical protein
MSERVAIDNEQRFGGRRMSGPCAGVPLARHQGRFQVPPSRPGPVGQLHPDRSMIARVRLASDRAINAGSLEAVGGRRVQQQMIDPQSRVSLPSIPHVMLEGVHRLARVKGADSVYPSLFRCTGFACRQGHRAVRSASGWASVARGWPRHSTSSAPARLPRSLRFGLPRRGIQRRSPSVLAGKRRRGSIRATSPEGWAGAS